MAVQCCLSIKIPFNLPLRQTSGMVAGLLTQIPETEPIGKLTADGAGRTQQSSPTPSPEAPSCSAASSVFTQCSATCQDACRSITPDARRSST
ncbi:hypothetical protein CEW88_15680 [Alloyangia pacifica]|uniref:Uncharacterized protein n=1 Tax=Alloyangia pacifica TaxID=311180 RepID=A0A2U8HHA6_9RHOB|nr:hypothetical protein CEW88_15680 [Alloyangia pacifica]